MEPATWSATTLIVVEAEGGGMQGLGYTYADPAVAGLINGTLAPAMGAMGAMDAMDPPGVSGHNGANALLVVGAVSSERGQRSWQLIEAKAAIIAPPRATAVPSETAETEPTQRDRHLHSIAKHGRAAWQNASGYTKRARVEAAIGRFKRVIGDGLRSRTDRRRAVEGDVAVHILNRMLELGRPISIRIP
jgi:hypothetical protein